MFQATASSWSGKHVFVTGACGTVGRALIAKLRALDVASITGIDINETELFFMREALKSDPRAQLLLCDIRIASVLSRAMHGTDIVLHAAAYKHVDICERSPNEAVMTNIIGTQNIINSAFENHVERVIFTSSDKAVNPTSVMGTSKLMAERLMTAASTQGNKTAPTFASIRFGNVLGSRGSVVPLFIEQIRNGGPVTLTDRSMTRFVMSIDQAVDLVLDAVFLARGGEVIVTKMPVVRIEDLADVMIRELAPSSTYNSAPIELAVIGKKPGEKMHEELTNEEEVRRTFDSGNYLVVKPAFEKYGQSKFSDWERDSTPLTQPYNSGLSPLMAPEEIAAFLYATNTLVRNTLAHNTLV